MFGGAFMRPEWGKDGSGQSPSERLFKLRLKATSAFTTSYYPRAFSGRFEAELRCTDTRKVCVRAEPPLKNLLEDNPGLATARLGGNSGIVTESVLTCP